MKLHIIYTQNQTLLSKQTYASWREIQDQYPGYMASLGPYTPGEMLGFLVEEYPHTLPDAQAQLEAFINSPAQTVQLRFRPASA